MFNKLENRGSERQSNLPKATQLVEGSAETQAQFCPLPKPVLLSLPRLGWVWDPGLAMQGHGGRGSQGQTPGTAQSPSYPVVPVTKINRNDLGTTGPGLPLTGFFRRYIDPHPATKPHKTNRADVTALVLLRYSLPSGFRPRHRWPQKLRFLD